jgi:hypothetical protein
VALFVRFTWTGERLTFSLDVSRRVLLFASALAASGTGVGGLLTWM